MDQLEKITLVLHFQIIKYYLYNIILLNLDIFPDIFLSIVLYIFSGNI